MLKAIGVVIVTIVSFYAWFNGYDIIIPIYAIFITLVILKGWNGFKNNK